MDGTIQTLQRLYLWACERLYAEFAWSYDIVSWLVSWGAWADWQATALNCIDGNAREQRILEIGFGTGNLLQKLAQCGYQVTGLELSTAMHRQTERKLANHNLSVSRVQASADLMPFAAGSFDTIIATFPSNYITQPATLRECCRLLRARSSTRGGGRLVIVMGVSNVNTPWGYFLRWLADNDRSGKLPFRENSTLFQRLAAAGFHARHQPVTDHRATVHLIVAERT